jgi:bacterioferritin (cytochrome b1)
MEAINFLKEYWALVINLVGLITFIGWLKFDLIEVKKTVESHVACDKNLHDKLDEKIATMEDKHNTVEKDIVEIKTILKGMEGQINDIKEMLKKK